MCTITMVASPLELNSHINAHHDGVRDFTNLKFSFEYFRYIEAGNLSRLSDVVAPLWA